MKKLPGEPDYGPLFVAGAFGIIVLGIWSGRKLYETLRAKRQTPAAPPTPPDTTPPNV